MLVLTNISKLPPLRLMIESLIIASLELPGSQLIRLTQVPLPIYPVAGLLAAPSSRSFHTGGPGASKVVCDIVMRPWNFSTSLSFRHSSLAGWFCVRCDVGSLLSPRVASC